ncbi:hypothetical protein DFH08DRAFT_843476 [Mycena albidolilacea]|uniref:Uncharacterized protein n=1 Tax=Mycena albidolilacea TaxID=1033008 RepID=A0AAD7ALF1_9AGAR|nr:hypothetical protein DFH08DRAFT_843476 [Mycena albidolilacea]
MCLRQSFIPVYASEEGGELNNNSIVIGGSTMYLSPDEAWPTCDTCSSPLVPFVQMNVSSENTPDAFRARFLSVPSAGGNLATMVQLFVCRDYDCFEGAVMQEECSWILRLATVPLVPPPSNAPHLAEGRTKIENGGGFLPPQLVETWTAGKDETLHWELDVGVRDYSDEFYNLHEPERGLKLLGHSERGKYHYEGDCAAGDCAAKQRELIQLGDQNCWDADEALGIMGLLGNVWIQQCETHLDQLTLGMSGTW